MSKRTTINCAGLILCMLLQACVKTPPAPTNSPPGPSGTQIAPQSTPTPEVQPSASPMATQEQNSLALPSSTVKDQNTEQLTLPATDEAWKRGMNVYSRKAFSLPDRPGYQFTIQLYTDAEKTATGFNLDVGQSWGMTLVTDKGEFVVVEKQYINHGGIDYYPFFKIHDTTGQYDYDHLFILATMSYSAGISVFEYDYDVKNQRMSQNSVYEGGNINPF